MKLAIRKIITAVFALLLVVGAVGMASQLVAYYNNHRIYTEALAMVGLDDTALPYETAASEGAVDTSEPEETLPVSEFLPEWEETTAEAAADETECEAAETELPEAPETEGIPPEPPVITPTDPYADMLFGIDISPLRERNGDAFGWIMIPGTSINYPLVQGNDNTHYLNYAWDGTRNAGGAIFIDYRSNTDLSDFHTIIYGHRMYRDAMFNALGKYRDPQFLKEHPSVYIRTEGTVRKYDVFAAYEADVKGSSYRLGLSDVKGQQALFDYCMYHSEIDTGITPDAQEGDKLLTLSTCTAAGDASARWVVHFVLSGEYTAD